MINTTKQAKVSCKRALSSSKSSLAAAWSLICLEKLANNGQVTAVRKAITATLTPSEKTAPIAFSAKKLVRSCIAKGSSTTVIRETVQNSMRAMNISTPVRNVVMRTVKAINKSPNNAPRLDIPRRDMLFQIALNDCIPFFTILSGKYIFPVPDARKPSFSKLDIMAWHIW